MRGGVFGDPTEDGMWPSETVPSRVSDQVEEVDVDAKQEEAEQQQQQQQLGSEFKEVVIVGNGPSGISLSYLLSGNWPYYGDVVHPLDFLHQRLETNQQVSLIVKDLRSLSEGLEGRSNNPVSILFDSLIHPDADLGVESPSCLRWTRHRDKVVDHVVLGKGLPGGAWQNMEQSALTLSLNNWMELPNLEYKAWEQEMLREHHITPGGRQSRASVGNVAKYYNEYVHLQRLEKHFRNHCTVTAVRPIPCRSSSGADPSARATWEVLGHSGWEQTPFHYVTPHVVLATGSHDLPNRLHVPGENLPIVLHSSTYLDRLIGEQRLGAHSDPLLIVGAGLTAADAVITARFYGVPVAHVFRRPVDDRSLIFNKLPENMYPEYHKVHQMMRNCGQGYNGSYRSYAQHSVVDILPGGKVRLEGPQAGVVLHVSYVLVLIGSRPDLSFLSEDLLARLKSGVGEGATGGDGGGAGGAAAVRVDAFTHECVHLPGMFALGPLVGDNFVRFLQGGAVAAASHLIRVVLGAAETDEVVVDADGVVSGAVLDGGGVAARRRSCSFDRPSLVYKPWQVEGKEGGGGGGGGEGGADWSGAKSEEGEEGGPARRLRATPKKTRQHRRRLFSHSSCDRLNL